jgi:hypothetical protein
MQTTRKATRYYIDRDADMPVIRTVPVARQSVSALAASQPALDHHAEGGENGATAFAASESRRRDARRRLTSMVQASVRKYRHHPS